ncbi:wall-associated receptor kinase 3-like [Hibiscus syriacus]|uniref:Wall-associated receptor kinase 3-like n=1 Tax=Hibiscus syriacus TaxID=106335 RepID=A0A6A2YPL3_HIBSY|nr:wall-associated receptor kinase 3-like [Hibiscus syriacus]
MVAALQLPARGIDVNSAISISIETVPTALKKCLSFCTRILSGLLLSCRAITATCAVPVSWDFSTDASGAILIFIFNKGPTKLRDQKEVVDALKGYSTEFKEQIERSYEEKLMRITEMVESKLKETTARLEQQLAEEQAARLKAEEMAQLAQMKSNDEIRKLRENLVRAQKETEELKQAARCTIL